MRIEKTTGPYPRVSRKPRPGPSWQTARCAARRRLVAAPGRSAPAAVWAVARSQVRLVSTDDADRASHGARPACDRPLPVFTCERILRWPSWYPLLAVGQQGNPQDLGECVWNPDDRFGLMELGRQPLVHASEPIVLGDQGGIGRGFSPATFGSQTGQVPSAPCYPQVVRCNESRPTRRNGPAELAKLGIVIGLAKSAKLVFRRETSSHSFLRHSRVRIDFPLPVAGAAGAAVAGGTTVE